MGEFRSILVEQSVNALYPVPDCRVEQVMLDDSAYVRILARGLNRD